MTFQPGTVCASKSGTALSPVSRTATTTEGSPRVTSQAWVVCVWYQPQAPPESAYVCGKNGSFGRISCGFTSPSGSTQATEGLAFSAHKAAWAWSGATETTCTPRWGIVPTGV